MSLAQEALSVVFLWDCFLASKFLGHLLFQGPLYHQDLESLCLTALLLKPLSWGTMVLWSLSFRLCLRSKSLPFPLFTIRVGNFIISVVRMGVSICCFSPVLLCWPSGRTEYCWRQRASNTAHSSRSMEASQPMRHQASAVEMCKAATWSSLYTLTKFYWVHAFSSSDASLGGLVLQAMVYWSYHFS